MAKFVMLIDSDPSLLEAMPQDEFNATMRSCVRNSRRTIVDGPFTETKELLAGFNVIEAESMEDAMRMASEFPWADTGCIEVRPVLEVETVRERVKG